MNFNLAEINLGLTLILIGIIIWQSFRISRLNSVRKHFYSSGLKKNLENVVTEQDAEIKKINSEIADLNQQTELLRVNNQNNFQKNGFIRFSPYGEAGNLSFALALLDAHDNGFVISSLHGREGTRVYAKNIQNGKSQAKLTEEEIQALGQITTLTENPNGKKR